MKRTQEQIAKAKAQNAKAKANKKKKNLQQMARDEARHIAKYGLSGMTKRERKKRNEEMQLALMAEKAREKAEREADPNYIAMMERKAELAKEKRERDEEARMALIEIVRMPLRRKPRKSK